jgi:hypothetical protein
VVDGFAALLANEIAPEALPADWGTNFAENEALCPTASVVGRLSPESTNSELLLAADEMVTGEPVAVNVPDIAALALTFTLP